MYNALFLILVILSAACVLWGTSKKSVSKTVSGVLLLVMTFGLFGLLSFWTEYLWFDALEYRGRFWTVVFSKLGFAALAGLISALIATALTWGLPRRPSAFRFVPITLVTLTGTLWGYFNWDVILKWWHATDTGISDPVLGRDVGFYLFQLPFWDNLYYLMWWVAIIPLFSAAIYFFLIRQIADRPRQMDLEFPSLELNDEEFRTRRTQITRCLFFSMGILAFVLAFGKVLDRFHLLYSPLGTVNGAGWTDVSIRLPGYSLTAALTALIGLILILMACSKRLHDRFVHARYGSPSDLSKIVGWPVGITAAIWFVVLGLAPVFTQWLWVSPNEITVERPFIAHNISFTREAFGLSDMEEQEYSVSEELTQSTLEKNQHLLSEVRLWDPRALLATYEQFQEIRLYYEFNDVDIDRYTIDGKYRQVMISPREMETANLPGQSQTFVNQHFKYTHGYGLTLAPVSDFTSEGLPDLLVKDLPPRSEAPELNVDRPAIYYGEQTDGFVVANSDEEEFDYPQGESNAYVHYDGDGGILLKNWWRKFVLGWRLGGTRFLVSGYPNNDSRVMFRRDIRTRLKTLAPFLTFDTDPYVVLDEGQLFWIVDAYTTSDRYPYSEALAGHSAASQLNGTNYVRNSVKAVIDAFDGTVSLYVFEPEDPIIQVWQKIFPKLFKTREEMPAGLVNHIRYPEGLLTAQGLVYSKYHMTDPAVFYNQEDLWVHATEKYYSSVQPVEPYYIMWEPPESEEPEFILMQPFTPKNRQVLIGWIAGMCDGENYGRLLAYRFPKEKRILGTQQVETKIDQDSYLSGQLTLWDQRGSNVLRGNLLVIPLNGTLLYIEPIYLQAEAAAYPELRLVAVMHYDRLSYAETFDEALQGLFEDGPSLEKGPTAPSRAGSAELAAQANEHFKDYLRFMGEEKFEQAAQSLDDLKSTLEKLEDQEKAQDLEESDSVSKRLNSE